MTNEQVIEALEQAHERCCISAAMAESEGAPDYEVEHIRDLVWNALAAIRAQGPALHELGKRYGDFATERQHIALVCGSVRWTGTAWEHQCERPTAQEARDAAYREISAAIREVREQIEEGQQR